jgi:uncharacterized protein (DUF433 family)
MTSISTEHISKTPGVCGGKACIAGHRIRVLDIAIYHDMGKTPAEMIDMFPSITEADVHAAIAYYLDNREEIQGDLRREHEMGEKLRQKFPSKLKQKLGG